MRRELRWLLLAPATACFVGDIDATGKLCPCPSGYVCLDGRCSRGAPRDAAPPDAAPEPDDAGTPPVAAEILWSANFEAGDLGEWNVAGAGRANESDRAVSEVTTSRAHGGTRSMLMRIDGDTGGTFNRRWGVGDGSPLPDDAVYGAWLLLPRAHTHESFWHVMSWYSRLSETETRAVHALSIAVDSATGGLRLRLQDTLHRQILAASEVPLPLDEWVHVEVRYRFSAARTGGITVWQNGVEVMAVDAIQTELLSQAPSSRRWALMSFTEGIAPPSPELFADDVTIATGRIAP